MTAQTIRDPQPSLSDRLAAEVRAEMARQQVSARAVAARAGKSHAWVARRVTAMEVPIDLDDLATIASALGRDVSYFLRWLPWYDSNVQPAGLLGTRGRSLGTSQGYLKSQPRLRRVA